MSEQTITPELRDKLRAPFTVAAVKFRPLEKPNDRGVVGCLVYIDARLAAERLSFADPAWSSSYEVLAGPQHHMPVVCKLTVCGVTREGVGQNASPQMDDKHAKMAFSDALKRAAVEFGVGASLYAMPRFTVETGGYWVKSNGKVGGLTAAGIRNLRAAYTRALADKEFIARYGEAIDHGDMLHEPEDLAPVEAPPVEAGAAVARVSDDQAELLARLAVLRRPNGPPLDAKLAEAREVLAEDFARVLDRTLKGAVKDGVLTADDQAQIAAAAVAEATIAEIIDAYPQLDAAAVAA